MCVILGEENGAGSGNTSLQCFGYYFCIPDGTLMNGKYLEETYCKFHRNDFVQ